MRKIIVALFAALFAVGAMADEVTLSKCGGQVVYPGELYVKDATTVSGAVKFTSTEMKPYVGGQLTKVRAYIGDTKNMLSLEMWVKNNQNDAKKLGTVKVASPKVGWNEVEFETPIAIASSKNYTIGFTYTQPSGSPCYAISLCDDRTAGGCLLSMGGSFSDYSIDYPNLCIEGTVSGITPPDQSLKIDAIALNSIFYKTGTNGSAAVTFTNSGKELSAVTLRVTSAGQEKDVNVSGKVAFAHSATNTIAFPVPEELDLNAEVKVQVVAIDGVAYESNAVSAKYAAYEKIYDRNVVVEEGTGTWCGWCVHGMIAMDMMKEKYPDTFIGIAAHNGDGMALSNYTNSLGISGFPGCTVDRVAGLKGATMHPTLIEGYYNTERNRGTFADFDFNAWINDDGKIEVESSATFDYDKTAADVRINYILLEDGVTGYSQANYYSGGGNGVMGGFESMPETISNIEFNDVARRLYPSFSGTKNSFVANITRGETYTHTTTYAIPTTVKNQEKLRLVALMIDGASGEIINAHQVKLGKKDELDGIADTYATPTDHKIYNLNGQAVKDARNGLYIIGGRKVVVKQ